MAYDISSDSPQVWWKLDETSGVVANDSSGNGYNGANTNLDVNQGAILPSGEGNSYNANNDADILVKSGIGGTSEGSMSGEVWWEPGSTGKGTDDTIMWLGQDTGSDIIDVAINGSGYIFAYVWDGAGGASATSAYTPVEGTVVYIAVTYNGSTKDIKLYIDGSLVDTGNYATGGIDFGAGGLRLNRHYSDSARSAHGQYSNAAAYFTVLSPTQISNHYNAGLGSAPNAPTGVTAVQAGDDIQVTWTDNSSDETGFRVERFRTGDADWVQIGQVTANITLFLDQNASAGEEYTYRVRSYNGFGDSVSAASSAVTFTTAAPGAATLTITGYVPIIVADSGGVSVEVGSADGLVITGFSPIIYVMQDADSATWVTIWRAS